MNRTPTFQSVARHYAEWVIPDLFSIFNIYRFLNSTLFWNAFYFISYPTYFYMQQFRDPNVTLHVVQKELVLDGSFSTNI
jgi:hypothetical protein